MPLRSARSLPCSVGHRRIAFDVQVMVRTQVVVARRIQCGDRSGLDTYLDSRGRRVFANSDNALHRLETATDPADHQMLGAKGDKGVRWVQVKCARWRHEGVIDDATVVTVRPMRHMPLLTKLR